jgi:DNA repair protein SbcD/Mre11
MREIKLLQAADLHLDSAFESLSPEKAIERRKGQRALLSKLAAAAEERGVQAVLLVGDVFDGAEVEHDTLRDFCRAMGALPCPVIIAPGNHDPYSVYSVWETSHLPENIFVFKNAEIEGVEFPGVRARFWGAGFQNTFSRPLLSEFEAPEKRHDMPDVMIIHGEVGTGESAYNLITREDLLKSGMDYVALGHIHARSPLKMAGETVYAYSGCTEGRGFDETGEKGALLVTISDDGISSEFIPLGGVRYEIINVDISGKNPLEAVLTEISALSARDSCRIVLTGECTEPPDLSFLRKKLDGALSELQIKDETTLKRDVWTFLGQDTLSGVFLGRLNSLFKSADSAEEREKIELAARYGLAAIDNGGDLI